MFVRFNHYANGMGQICFCVFQLFTHIMCTFHDLRVLFPCQLLFSYPSEPVQYRRSGHHTIERHVKVVFGHDGQVSTRFDSYDRI